MGCSPLPHNLVHHLKLPHKSL